MDDIQSCLLLSCCHRKIAIAPNQFRGLANRTRRWKRLLLSDWWCCCFFSFIIRLAWLVGPNGSSALLHGNLNDIVLTENNRINSFQLNLWNIYICGLRARRSSAAIWLESSAPGDKNGLRQMHCFRFCSSHLKQCDNFYCQHDHLMQCRSHLTHIWSSFSR